jgi:hypothetical protein
MGGAPDLVDGIGNVWLVGAEESAESIDTSDPTPAPTRITPIAIPDNRA